MLPEPVPGLTLPDRGPLIDRFGRVHTYLRVSVTDRCNYRCVYCMPAEKADFLPHEQVLTFEEITRIARVFVGCGVTRFRLTGGEPTVRRDIERLVSSLAVIPGVDDLAMTTNGHRFAALARPLAEAGLRRVNISIDSLDQDQFRRMTRGGDVARVIDAIDAALDAGLTPVKLNVVIMGGENEAQVDAMVERFVDPRVVVRFIEWMPFDFGRFGVPKSPHHVPAASLRARLAARHDLSPVAQRLGGGPAAYWRFGQSNRVVGFISPMTEHFCQSCNRLRLQADGHLRTCLSREAHASLRDRLRAGLSDADLEREIRDRLWAKVAGHEAHLDAGRPFEGTMTSVGG
jgi:cyclic pyranopterin phosphate synthase